MAKYVFNSYVVTDYDSPNIFSANGRWWYDSMAEALEHFRCAKRGKLSIVSTWMSASGFSPKALCTSFAETVVMDK